MNSSNQIPAILQVLPELNTGGVERGSVDLALYAKQRGFRLITTSAGGRMVQKLTDAGCEHITLPLKTKNPFKIILNIFRLIKVCRKNNVKIIHARSRAPAWSAYFAAKTLKIHYITTFHGFYKNNFPLKEKYNAIMAKGEFVIAVSEFIRSHLIEDYLVRPERIVTIQRGVDMAEFNPELITEEQIRHFKEEKFIPLNVPVILLPGRITRWKGHDVALRAVAELDDVEFVLAFAGALNENSNFSKELLALVHDNKLEKKVKFMSNIENMKLAYASCDIVLSTSVEPETFGRISAEANAMGKFVIATDLGGSREIIKDNVTGWLVPHNDHRKLAQRMREAIPMVSDEKNKQKLIEVCRNNVEKNFSLQSMCEKTLNLYNQIYKFN